MPSLPNLKGSQWRLQTSRPDLGKFGNVVGERAVPQRTCALADVAQHSIDASGTSAAGRAEVRRFRAEVLGN
jgi:hypothetical protein